MGIEPRKITCDTTGHENISLIEVQPGAGFPGWGGLLGKVKDGHEIKFCPDCVNKISALCQSGKLLTVEVPHV